MKFLFLQYENRTQGISFYINSPGGSVTSTLAIYDTMQFIECPIATYCIGLAASGAAVLLAGGSKGRRYALPHSKIMIHQPYGQVGGQVSDIEIQAEEIVKSKQVINEILAKHTGQPIERIAKDTERDRYLTAVQAKEYGLVDEVVGRIVGTEKSLHRAACLLSRDNETTNQARFPRGAPGRLERRIPMVADRRQTVPLREGRINHATGPDRDRTERS